jgi:hypothetical protein
LEGSSGTILCSRAHILSFIKLMKDSLAFMDLCFVFHRPYEGQFTVHGPVFCLSSGL